MERWRIKHTKKQAKNKQKKKTKKQTSKGDLIRQAFEVKTLRLVPLATWINGRVNSQSTTRSALSHSVIISAPRRGFSLM